MVGFQSDGLSDGYLLACLCFGWTPPWTGRGNGYGNFYHCGGRIIPIRSIPQRSLGGTLPCAEFCSRPCLRSVSALLALPVRLPRQRSALLPCPRRPRWSSKFNTIATIIGTGGIGHTAAPNASAASIAMATVTARCVTSAAKGSLPSSRPRQKLGRRNWATVNAMRLLPAIAGEHYVHPYRGPAGAFGPRHRLHARAGRWIQRTLKVW